MRFHLGPPPLPAADPNSPLRFDWTRFSAHVGLWAGFPPLLLIGLLWTWRLGWPQLDALLQQLGLLGLLACMVLMMVLHEAVHAVWFPARARLIGLHWRGCYAYAACLEPMPRNRVIACALSPFLVLTVLPLLLAPGVLSGTALLVAVVVSAVNAPAAMGDVWVVWRVRKLPREVLLQGCADGINVIEPPSPLPSKA